MATTVTLWRMAYGKLLLSPLSVVAVYFVLLMVTLVVLIVAYLLQWLITKLTGINTRPVHRLQSRIDSLISKQPAAAMAMLAVPVHGWYSALPLVMARELGQDGAPLWLAQTCVILALATVTALFFGAAHLNDVPNRHRNLGTALVGATTVSAYLYFLFEPDAAIRSARVWKSMAWAGLEMMLNSD
ncbi:MAG: hypothetical protein U0R19_14800 [Bryobacteraceae bacterium]